MLCKSPPSHGSGEANNGRKCKDAVADKADICPLRQKDRDRPWEIRSKAKLNDRIGRDDDHEDDSDRGQIPFRDIGD